ncbi:putative multidrug resistance protein fnx1 [Erysiphe necator]|uniref:Putative multidrug resistance protein fnx1 n=1 Tax=Uncinula necator TaxID=52586 RepID=A0A0B1P0V7_UNCNE|nr:putative multidrug resistance protein fnx1 [Erysiphe necator]
MSSQISKRNKLSPEEKMRLDSAVDWILDPNSINPNTGKASTAGEACDRYQLDVRRRTTIHMRVKVARERGQAVKNGGQNQMLSDVHEKIVCEYITKLSSPGQLGATKQLTYKTISYLLSQESPPRDPPSTSWFSKWWKNRKDDLGLHVIKTKPMAQTRLESHTDRSIRVWFIDNRKWCRILNIKKSKRVWNMDETGARIRCPTGETVVVPAHVHELYTGSPENGLSITVIKTISTGGNYQPPFIILPGEKLMDNWCHENVENDTWATTSPTGYISSQAMLEYLKYFVKFSDSGPNKPWAIHIYLQIFPSHGTHALQPLDVGIFRKWKHQQNRYINMAIRQYDFKYSLSSFFRNVSEFRKHALKSIPSKIIFSKPGIWPISFKKALRSRARYMGQIRRQNEKAQPQRIGKRKEVEAELDEPELPRQLEHLHPRPTTNFEAAKIIEEICKCDTLEPPSSPGTYKESLSIAHDLLIKADLQADTLQNYESAMMAERQCQTSTRKSVHKGGGINVGQWKTKIESRNAKREYLKTLGTSPPCPIIMKTFREPDKDETCRTVDEVASLLPPPDLQQTLNILKEDIELRWGYIDMTGEIEDIQIVTGTMYPNPVDSPVESECEGDDLNQGHLSDDGESVVSSIASSFRSYSSIDFAADYIELINDL